LAIVVLFKAKLNVFCKAYVTFPKRVVQNIHTVYFHTKMVAGVGFESRSRICGIMSLKDFVKSNASFLAF
jgi:hypothetical protein